MYDNVSRISKRHLQDMTLSQIYGSVSLYVNSLCTKKHPLAQQVKVGTSIYLSLDALELIHFALRLPVAILHIQSSSNRVKVPIDACRQAVHLLDPAGFGLL